MKEATDCNLCIYPGGGVAEQACYPMKDAGLLSQHVRLEKDENSNRQALLNFPGRTPYFSARPVSMLSNSAERRIESPLIRHALALREH